MSYRENQLHTPTLDSIEAPPNRIACADCDGTGRERMAVGYADLARTCTTCHGKGVAAGGVAPPEPPEP